MFDYFVGLAVKGLIGDFEQVQAYHVCINPFRVTGLFLYLLKTSENQVLQGVQEKIIGMKCIKSKPMTKTYFQELVSSLYSSILDSSTFIEYTFDKEITSLTCEYIFASNCKSKAIRT